MIPSTVLDIKYNDSADSQFDACIDETTNIQVKQNTKHDNN
jgi:hypothetical protein